MDALDILGKHRDGNRCIVRVMDYSFYVFVWLVPEDFEKGLIDFLMSWNDFGICLMLGYRFL
jgi:hypothetical protein